MLVSRFLRRIYYALDQSITQLPKVVQATGEICSTGTVLDGTKLNLDWWGTIYHTPKDDINQPFDLM